jgi:hypothetical protein
VGGKQLEGLDFFEFLNLFNGLKFLLHALDRDVLTSFEGVGHEHFRKGAVAALGLQSILIHERAKSQQRLIIILCDQSIIYRSIDRIVLANFVLHVLHDSNYKKSLNLNLKLFILKNLIYSIKHNA